MLMVVKMVVKMVGMVEVGMVGMVGIVVVVVVVLPLLSQLEASFGVVLKVGLREVTSFLVLLVGKRRERGQTNKRAKRKMPSFFSFSSLYLSFSFFSPLFYFLPLFFIFLSPIKP